MGDSARYAVVKNTLTKIAAKQAGLTGLDELLTGPTAVAFVSGDPVEAAKGLRDFARTNPLLIIKGGVLDGNPISAAEISRLADLESREVLLAKLAGAMNASLSKAVNLFAAPLSQAARLIEALRQQRRGRRARRGCRSSGGSPSTGETFVAAEAAAEAAADAAPATDESADPSTRRGRRRPPRTRQPPPLTRPLPPKRTNTMAKMSTDDLLEAFKEMTLLELSEFVKQFEDTFGVTAAAPVAVAAAPVAAAALPRLPRPRSRTSSTSSSRLPATRRSRSSRRCARSPASA